MLSVGKLTEEQAGNKGSSREKTCVTEPVTNKYKRDEASGSKLNAIMTGGETPNDGEGKPSFKYCQM